MPFTKWGVAHGMTTQRVCHPLSRHACMRSVIRGVSANANWERPLQGDKTTCFLKPSAFQRTAKTPRQGARCTCLINLESIRYTDRRLHAS